MQLFSLNCLQIVVLHQILDTHSLGSFKGIHLLEKCLSKGQKTSKCKPEVRHFLSKCLIANLKSSFVSDGSLDLHNSDVYNTAKYHSWPDAYHGHFHVWPWAV